MSNRSKQVGGDHYMKDVQPWDAMRSWMTDEQFEGFLRGNVIKYIARYKDKNGVEDLRKCKHYLQELIGMLEEADVMEFKTSRLNDATTHDWDALSGLCDEK